MRMTEQKFNRLKRLTGKLPVSDIAEIVGLKPQSIPAYGRFSTWLDYQAYKARHNAKQRAMKKSKQLVIPMPLATANGQTSTDKLLVDINNSLQRLIELEITKSAKRDAYHARKGDQIERTGFRSYFQRGTDE